ncbi:MAG TPA: hypothetical protein VLH60_06280 [Sedimentisphaerales bacterium]|nr:hypothetical protein [Sedimentisphaerales bacterium]
MKNTSAPAAENPKSTAPRGRKKLLLLIPVALAALIVIVLLILPVWVSSSSGRAFIVNKVNRSTNGELAIGNLSMGWFSGISADDLSFSDAAGRMMVSVKRFATSPNYLSFLGGGVELGKTVIEQPRIQITIPETPPDAAAAQDRRETAGPVGLPIRALDLTIKDGSVFVSPAAGYQNVQISNIAAKVDIRPGNARSDFDLAMNVESGGGISELKASGGAAGITEKGWRLADTTGDLNIRLSDLDLGSLQGLLAASGVKIQASGRLSSNITANIDNGQIKGLDISMDGDRLEIGGEALKGDTVRTSKLRVVARLSAQAQRLDIQEAQVITDWLNITAAGSLPTKALSVADLMSPASEYAIRADISCNIAQVFSLMPNLLGMKPGMQLSSGSLRANVDSSVSEGRRIVAGNATISDLKGTVDGQAVALAAPLKIDAKVTSDGRTMLLDRGTVTGSFGEISGTGPFENLAYTARLDLAKLMSEAGQFVDMAGYAIAGNFEGSGTVAVKNGAVATAGRSAMTNLQISVKDRQARLQSLALAHDVRYDAAAKALALNSVTIDGDFGRAAVTGGSVTMGDKAGMNLPVTAQLDLRRLLPFAVAFGGLPEDMDLGGNLVANVSARREGSAWHIAAKDTGITDFVMRYPGQQPLSQKQIRIALDATIDPAQKTIALRQFNIASDIINASGNFEKTAAEPTSTLRGRINATYDLAAVSTLAAPYLPQGLTIRGKRSQDLTLSSTWPTAEPKKMLAAMNARTTFGFDELRYMGMTFGRADLSVNMENGLLSIKPFSVPLNNGRLNFGATADFTRTPTFLVLSSPMAVLEAIHITDEMVGYDKVKRWLEMIPLTSDASRVTGIAGFKCTELRVPLIGAGAEAVVAAGTFDVNDLRTNSGLLRQLSSAIGRDAAAITILPTAFTLRDGVIRYDSLRMIVAGEMVEFRGWVGLNDTMDLSVVTPVRVADSRLTLHIDGSPTRPNLNLGRTIQENVPGLILQEVLRRR